ncbi:hypothetical protein [Acetobacter orleanensis]|uniref:Uncharacterized protein n=1 Tax=Acetobacter orleanensis TaxID=104099 RepID=A0A4Y3TL43_9PROT|nr:hypothetical protein [Acetobacter orleanensis]KXV65376.1 hypothetical protein AD949_04465 [Acetobacter orleanensis]GAN68553.1 hypothetical protein Abol_019_030 [Acetobacter orleanensis JCM 7639]GBR22993.1 hypothetical protein AA0473_0272 [Acetobacter orleanensis NRIC 0473]GEB82642.1 hypothetical protein AOR01nite_11190 [Acetobacter orleanensis]
MTPLPDILVALLNSADENVVLSFMDANGGQQISVPRVAEGSSLESCFGRDLALALVNFAGGSSISIPQCRRWRIWKLAELGYSRNEIALRVGTTSRWVNAILKMEKSSKPLSGSAQHNSRQMDIMDFLGSELS